MPVGTGSVNTVVPEEYTIVSMPLTELDDTMVPPASSCSAVDVVVVEAVL